MFIKENSLSSEEDEQPKDTKNLFLQSFKVKAWIKILVYNKIIDAEKMDNLLFIDILISRR